LLQLGFLGDIRISVEGAACALPRSRKTRALLAYLAMTGRPHRRERLCSMFWEVPDDPRGALRWSLSKLRALVDEPGRSRIRADREFVGFDPAGAEIDVLSLRRRLDAGLRSMNAEQLAETAAAFRGEFLEGLELESCPEFQAWCVAERQELRLLHRGVLMQLVDMLASRPDLALPHIRTLVALDPFDETLRANLVRTLAADGRRDEAQKQYELGRRTLAELGAAMTGVLDRAWREVRNPPRPTLQADAASAAAPARSSEAIEQDRAEGPQAERKQVTVLVALVGRPLGLDPDGDPETVMQALDPTLDAMKDTVRRYDGIVSSTQPDGLIAVFGAPVAHEDHAVRACHAAIAMQASVRNPTDRSPVLRIGLHSGEAVVRTTKDGPASRFEAIGPVVSVASQVGALAEPGVTILTRETAWRAEGFVQVQPLESSTHDPDNELSVLRGAIGTRTRWEVRAARGLTPFVGRDPEMEALAKAMRRVESGIGGIVAVVADPGIGKSRLMHEFVREAVPPGWGVLAASALPHDAKATYRPVSGLLRSWFGIEERDLKPEIERKVRARIEEPHPELRSALPALLSLLDLPVADTDWPTLSPPQRRRRTLEAVKALVACECRTRPLVLLFEDLHWIDGETQAVLDTLVDSLGGLRLLLLVTHRPEYRHGWAGKSYFSQLRLLPLPAKTSERLLESLLGSDPGLLDLRRELAARTEGTPLFIEETVRALAEAGALAGPPGDCRLARPVDAIEIPTTVQAVIAARIDRLPAAAKNLLQVASVIGRDIPLALLRQVAGLPEEALYDALADLKAAEFLYEADLIPDIVFTFKHALIHEVCYGSVLRELRRTIHIEIVQTIEALYRDRIDEQVEHLARHAVKGRLWDQATHYLYRAAGKAIQRSAHRQAVEFLQQGLELIPKLADARARLRLELDYQKAIGVTMMAAKGWGAQEVSDAYVRAQSLAETLADDRELFVVLRGQGQFHMIRGKVQIARGFGDRCVALAAKADDAGMTLETHHLFWSNSLFMGDYAGAWHHSERGIALYDRRRDHPLTYVYSGHDPGVCCRCFSGLTAWQRGNSAQALAHCEDALALDADIRHPLTTALAYWGLSFVHLFRGEPARAQHAAEQEIAICEEYLLPLLLSQGRFQLGWSLAAQGALDEGIALMRSGLEAISATGAEMGKAYFSALFAEALAKSGRPTDGLAEIEHALMVVERDQARFQLPEIQRLKAELLLMQPRYDIDAVTVCLRDAMATASAQGAPLAELRAAASLARVLLDRNKRLDARRLLSELCGRAGGMPDSAELREARALLAGCS
jgi:DNA-binding SARP family transcriptional activator/predicted ATPase